MSTQTMKSSTKDQSKSSTKEGPSLLEKGKQLAGDIGQTIKSTISGSQPDTSSTTSTETKSESTTLSTSESANLSVVFVGAGKVECKTVPYPKMEYPWNNEPCYNGVILKVLSSAICGSDLHPYRGRTVMPPGTCLGHEFIGEVVERGSAVSSLNVGDWGAVSFNIGCGSCIDCKGKKPNACKFSNPSRDSEFQGGIFGYVCGGNWAGGQSKFAFVPWADHNILKFDNKLKAKEKLLDLTLITDVLPTAMHGCVEAGVDVGLTVFIAGAGPVGLSAIACAKMKGAACIFISDHNEDRLALARAMGANVINLKEFKSDSDISKHIESIIGCPFVDCAIECVGYEAKSMGDDNICMAALNTVAELIKPGGKIGVLGAYFSGDPKAPSTDEKSGIYKVPFGKLWMKGCSFGLGQATPSVYMKSLYNMIMFGNLNIAKDLNVKVWSLENAKLAYEEFNSGCASKMILDPNDMLQLHGFSHTSCSKSKSDSSCSHSDCSDKTNCSKTSKSSKSSKSSMSSKT